AFTDLLAEEYHSSTFEYFREAYMGDETPPFTTELKSRGGEEKVLEIKAQPVMSEGRIIGIMGIARDITERASKEKELKSLNARVQEANEFLLTANEELKTLDKLKNEFISVVSHELRTPLTSIEGYSELMLKGEVGSITDDQKEVMETVYRNAKRLDKLIKDILEISQLESGKTKYRMKMVDLNTIANNVSKTFKPMVEKKELKFEVFIDPDVPLIKCDEEKITRVLNNLLDNAIKFTPKNGTVSLEARKEKKDKVERLVISVSDTGVGVSQKNRSKLFTKFFQADTSERRKYGGTGLGLSICKAIVDGHKGKIWAASAEGIGSTFALTLPFDEEGN
ncbi:MAG: PAS domain S-box protein, partial [Candidatus Diapherotrites archaeon]|nr:PAS domain S-box protein [Candidatus Diapherotrites archaeon]